ncbi:MAG: DJ-1/PfpI family protein, partial [Deltaproteobacteria bacterium]|nr:DJ-1/PfpI family protein [Deltaproteobacteria bacterium]
LEELDLVGPWEMIGMWSKYAKGPQKYLMIAETEEPVTCANGMIITPHATFNNAPQLDYLLIPGGLGTRTQVKNEPLTDFVAKQAQNCKVMLSVCTGAFILHAAGLLSGKRATTHWLSLNDLKKLGDVEVVEERIVIDDNVWTSSGVSAGIDLALEFIKHEAGEEIAGKVQSFAEYYPHGRLYGTFHQDPNAPDYLSLKKVQKSALCSF